MKTISEQFKENRSKYLNHEMTHDEFYLWLADAIGVTFGDVPIPVAEINKSEDVHFNDIALHRWDAGDPWVRQKARRAGFRSWSLCETVCCLKAVAREAKS